MMQPKNAYQDFERALAERSKQRYVLRLYVSDLNVRSQRVIANVKAICEEYLTGRYDLEVIDLHQHPERAYADQLTAIPALVKAAPLPWQMFIGTLSNTGEVLRHLDLYSTRSQT